MVLGLQLEKAGSVDASVYNYYTVLFLEQIKLRYSKPA